MSALTHHAGGVLNALVSVPRGMTEDEAYRYLVSGELPSLGIDTLNEGADTDEDEVLDAGEVTKLLQDTSLTSAGGYSVTEIIHNFHGTHNQKTHGRRYGPDGKLKLPKPRVGDEESSGPRLSGREALTAAPVTIAANKGKEMACRPPTLDVCNDPNASFLRYNALENYRGADYDLMNRLLRGTFDENNRDLYVDDPETEWEDFEATIMDKVRRIDEVMEASKLPSDVRVMRATLTGRGIFDGHLGEDLTGFEWEEKSFTSTTVSDEVLDFFTGSDGGLIMTIDVPKGIGAVQLSDMPDEETGYDEAELLLQRGLKMQVVKDEGTDENNVRHLHVKVVQS
jgi:hypothetical protein